MMQTGFELAAVMLDQVRFAFDRCMWQMKPEIEQKRTLSCRIDELESFVGQTVIEVLAGVAKTKPRHVAKLTRLTRRSAKWYEDHV
jgi:hypothetical protein